MRAASQITQSPEQLLQGRALDLTVLLFDSHGAFPTSNWFTGKLQEGNFIPLSALLYRKPPLPTRTVIRRTVSNAPKAVIILQSSMFGVWPGAPHSRRVRLSAVRLESQHSGFPGADPWVFESRIPHSAPLQAARPRAIVPYRTAGPALPVLQDIPGAIIALLPRTVLSGGSRQFHCTSSYCASLYHCASCPH